jgi:hypothetical protein
MESPGARVEQIESVKRHEQKSRVHLEAAQQHDRGAEEWYKRGDSGRAELERRSARLERDAADIESARARLYRERGTQS